MTVNQISCQEVVNGLINTKIDIKGLMWPFIERIQYNAAGACATLRLLAAEVAHVIAVMQFASTACASGVVAAVGITAMQPGIIRPDGSWPPPWRPGPPRRFEIVRTVP